MDPSGADRRQGGHSSGVHAFVQPAVSCAVRLARADLRALTALHRRQIALAIGRATIGHGLIYVQVTDGCHPGRACEGWFIDRGRFPDEQAIPERGAFFRSGTLAWVGGRGWPARLGERIPVEADLSARPPADLEILVARRATLDDVQRSAPGARLQLLHALRPHRAPLYSLETMDRPDALGVLYDFMDLGPGTDVRRIPDHLIAHKRSGLIFLRLRDRHDPLTTLEGWFWDKMRHPSTRSIPRDGRLLRSGTQVFAGLGLERGRVVVDPRRGLAKLRALGAGFARVLGELRVSVEPRPGGARRGSPDA
jgi:hypothetical protein